MLGIEVQVSANFDYVVAGTGFIFNAVNAAYNFSQILPLLLLPADIGTVPKLIPVFAIFDLTIFTFWTTCWAWVDAYCFLTAMSTCCVQFVLDS